MPESPFAPRPQGSAANILLEACTWIKGRFGGLTRKLFTGGVVQYMRLGDGAFALHVCENTTTASISKAIRVLGVSCATKGLLFSADRVE